jgi:hypothetical protein
MDEVVELVVVIPTSPSSSKTESECKSYHHFCVDVFSWQKVRPQVQPGRIPGQKSGPRPEKSGGAPNRTTEGDEGMTRGSSILAYLVFGPGRTSTEGIARSLSMIAWRSPGARLGVQCKTQKDLVELGLV